MEKDWTPEQKRAINDREKSILISAAAGSGKTATLTQRIISRLTDKKDPVDITSLLIVTFTKAAAGELKARIRGAIQQELSLNPQNSHLQNQILLLNKAQICTIDSFCHRLIHSNFERLGLNANVRIGDETENRLLSQQVAQELIEDCYQNVTDDVRDQLKDFDQFCLYVSGGRDEHLSGVLLELYNKLQNLPQGIDWLGEETQRLGKEKDAPFFDSRYGEMILSWCIDFYSSHDAQFKQYRQLLYQNEAQEKGLGAILDFYIDVCHMVLKALHQKDIATAIDYMSRSAPRAGSVKTADKTPEFELINKCRQEFQKRQSAVLTSYFSVSDDKMVAIFETQIWLLKTLSVWMQVFDKRLNSAKRKKNLISFADQERLAAVLLYDAVKKRPTQLAQSISSQYAEIYIDEYQDVNPLQDLIFSSITKKNNLFLVGDIKQSIYGFRGATPGLFAKYRSEFDQEDREEKETIFLSENFRCDSQVIAFSNAVFGILFPQIVRGVPYVEKDALVHAKRDAYQNVQEKVEIRVFAKEDGASDTLDEAHWVAKRIQELLQSSQKRDQKKLVPSDIAILLRSSKNTSVFYEQALKELGLDSVNQAQENLFENPEVLLVLSLLHVINNREQDIYLTAVLKSPLYRFTLDDLVKIRSTVKEGSLFHALSEYQMENSDEKCRYFLEKLAYYQELSVELPVDKLLWFLYRDTGILGMVFNRSDQKAEEDEEQSAAQMKANLMLLYEHARQFENGEFQGLYQFINYITDMIEKNEVIKHAQITSQKDGAVRIMTVHQSKGLEFPVCFLCNTGKGFNREEYKNNFVFHKTLGLPFKMTDANGFSKLSTPLFEAMKLKVTQESLEEEMRVLYVALTRAREQLFVTGTIGKPQEFLKTLQFSKPDYYRLSSYDCPIKMMLHAANASGKDCYALSVGSVPLAKEELEKEDTVENDAPDEAKIQEYYIQLQEKLDYRYPYEASRTLPSKLAVSKLHPSILDEQKLKTDTQIRREPKIEPSTHVLPRFLQDEKTISAAERGTLTHVFMQFCDFFMLKEYGVEKELDRLVNSGFLSKTEGDLVRRDWIVQFMKSETFDEMIKAKRIWREKRFTSRFPARDLTTDEAFKSSLPAEETVMVQGVIDCFYENSDGAVTVLDYKTDSFSKNTSREEAIQTMIDRHSNQLHYYQKACEEMTQRKVTKLLLYSFSLGIQIPIS